MEKDEIFNLIKNKQYDKFKKYIKNNNVNLDIKDKHFNYPIHYLVKYNDYEIIDFVLKNNNIRLDILDTDGRNLLYIPIKFNYLKVLDVLLKYNKNSIGVNIIDKKDKLGLTGLHYSCIFNNLESLKILLQNNADLFITDNDQSNCFDICFEYERNDILLHLIKKIDDLNFLNSNSKNILQIAFERENMLIINYLINNKVFFNINNKDSEYGNTILHTATILNYDIEIIKKLLEVNANVNIQDFVGNTPLHYAISEKNIQLINLFINNFDNFNIENLEGNTVLHSYLINMNLTNIENYIISKEFKILKFLIENTNLNIQNNNGKTPLLILVLKKLWDYDIIYNILKKKELNIFIEDNNNLSVISYLSNQSNIIDLVSESYYYQLQKNKKNLKDKWEINCADQDFNNIKDTDNKKKCISKIKSFIIKNKKSIPNMINFEVNLEYDVFVNTCYYTGNNLDTAFGLSWLKMKFNNIKFILSYPLTINNKLEKYYKKMGVYYNWKIDFSNIQIMWSYQKLIFPSNFNQIINNFDYSEVDFVIIPLGIDISNKENLSHANILIWDVKKNIIERFEPHGAYHPINFNYNSKLLDKLLENKFKQIDQKLKYRSPQEYLPVIGFEILENLEDDKCKRLGDPNGFCGLWCIWWCNQKLLYPNLSSEKLANYLIKRLKMDKKKFKNVIRNFSKNITDLRNNYLEKYSIDINDWIVNKYDQEIIDNLEKDILEIIN